MKKFNSDGGKRKDITNNSDDRDLNNLKGMSLESSTEILDDTILFTDEDLNRIREEMHSDEEDNTPRL